MPEFHPNSRERTYAPEVTLSCLIAGVLARDLSLLSCVVINNRNRLVQKLLPASSNTGSFAEARDRLDSRLVVQCAERLASNTLGNSKPDKIWSGFQPFVIDGTTLTADDTVENQSKFPQHGKQEKGVGFPIMRAVFLSSLATGMVHGFSHGPYKGKETGEMALARNVFPKLPESSLLLGDCYFPSYFVLAMLKKRGIQGLFPIHFARQVDFRRGKRIGPKDHLVVWVKPARPGWMSLEEYESYPPDLELREVCLAKETNRKKPFVVVTTLVESDRFPKIKLANMYKKRWKIEVSLRDFKVTFSLQHVNAKKPKTIELLIWVHILSYNILMWHLQNASHLTGIPYDEMGVKNAARVISNYSPLIIFAKPRQVRKILTQMYLEISKCRVGQRPDRVEPRAVKRRPKPCARMHTSRQDWKVKKAA